MIDLNIPKRTEGKYKSDIKNSDFYKYYKKNMPKVESLSGGITSGSYNITAKEYSTILKDINTSIIEIIIKENFDFVLPFRLGILSIKQKKIKYKLDKDGNLSTKNLSIDYKLTKELWSKDQDAKDKKIKIFHTNEHTDGNRIGYWWSKKGANVQGIKAYYFIPCRQVRRKPAQILKNYKLTFYETPEKVKYFKKKK